MNSKRLLNLITGNWPVKALSFGAALFLFFFHRVSILDTRTLAVALRIENAGSMVAVNNYPKTIRVSFRGERRLMDPITENDIDAFLDLLYCNTPGSYTLPVGLVKKGNALDVESLEISCDPQEIHIELDETSSKTIPVKPVTSGAVLSGYAVTQTHTAPQMVMAQGPASMLVKTASFLTEPVKLDGRSETFTTTLRIINNEPLIELIGGKTVEFTAEISAVIPERRYEDIPFTLENLDAGLIADIKAPGAAVLIQARSGESFENLAPENIQVILDAAAITAEGTYRLKPKALISLPPAAGNTGTPAAGNTGLAAAGTPAGNAADVPAGNPAGTSAEEGLPDGQRYTVLSVFPEYVEVVVQPAAVR